MKDENYKAFSALEKGVFHALETYANVHRGSGFNSMATTHLFEEARNIVREYLGINKNRYEVIFCTSRRAEALIQKLKSRRFKVISSKDIGLPLGVTALAAKRTALPKGAPFQTGGGTTKLIAQDWIIWARGPDKFEAGTPAIINIIAFARALLMIRKNGADIFKEMTADQMNVAEILFHDSLEDYTGIELLSNLKQMLIGKNVLVPTMEGVTGYTNLDNSASTRTFLPIWDAFCQANRLNTNAQKEIVKRVKSICADQLGAPSPAYEVIFTSNTTEAINLVAESMGNVFEENTESVVLSTMLEHSSNDLPWRMISDHPLTRLSIDEEGFIDFKELESVLSEYNKDIKHGKKRIKLVAVSGASNVLGSCNNITEISRIVHLYGAELLIDGAQLIAHRKVEMERSGVDYLAFSAHKVYAPFGCGVMMARKGKLNFTEKEFEVIRNSGEENTGGIAALGKSFVMLQRIGMDHIREEEAALTRLSISRLSQVPGLKIHGISDTESPRFSQKLGVISFALNGMMADKVANELAVKGGIGVRNGCLCAHMLVKHILQVSPGLEKFQRLISTLFPGTNFPGLTRISLGIENSPEDIDRLINSLSRITQNDKDFPNSKKDTKKQINDFVGELTTNVFNN